MELSPSIILGIIAGLVVGITLLVRAARHVGEAGWIIALMLFFSAISPPSAAAGEYGRTWLRPLQDQRSELYFASALLLFLAAVANPESRRLRLFPAAALINLVLQVFAGILDTRILMLDGWARVAMNLITTAGLLMVVPAMLRRWDDYLPFMRRLGAVGVVWAGAVVIQMLLDHRALVVATPSRFVGLLGNPQGAALYLPAQTIIVLWLMLNDPHRNLRWMWALTLAAFLLMVAWTGSRTGLLLTTTGIVSVLYARIGRAVLLLPVTLVGLYGIALLAKGLGVELPLDRLTSTMDTRSDAWNTLLDAALDAPLFGEGSSSYVENSYLLAWVVYGPLMAALVVLLVVTLFLGSLRALPWRWRVPHAHRSLLDLCAGYGLMYALGAMFEYFVVARIEANVLFVSLLPTVVACMLRLARAEEDEPTETPEQRPLPLNDDAALEY